MLFSVERAFVGRYEERTPLKTPAWEARALEAVTKHFMMWVTKIGTPKILNLLQRVCLLGKANVEKDPRHLRL